MAVKSSYKLHFRTLSDFKIYIHPFRDMNSNVDTIFDWYVI